MKNNLVYKLLNLLLLITVLISTNTSIARENGSERGGGGDPIVPEFREIGRKIYKGIKDVSIYSTRWKIPFKEFIKKVETATIQTTFETITVQGEVKTAWNDYDNTIKINIDRWNSISSSVVKKRLVFHEFLSLLGLEWNNFYGISSTIYNDYFLPPTLEDLGIFDGHLRRVDPALLKNISPINLKIEDSVLNLEVLFQGSLERVLKITKSFMTIENEKVTESYMLMLLEELEIVFSNTQRFSSIYNYTQTSAFRSSNMFKSQQIKLFYTQITALSLLAMNFINSHEAYREYLEETRSLFRSKEKINKLKRDLGEIKANNSKALSALKFSTEMTIEEIKEQRAHGSEFRLRYIQKGFEYIYDLFKN